MDFTVHNKLVSFIWSIADDELRDVILPMFVLRRLDCFDEIIKPFNERWFDGWEATPEEQRVKLINIPQHVANDPDFEAQGVNNQDEQNRRLALEKLICQAVSKERRCELDLYKHYASDLDFKHAFDRNIMQILEDWLGGVGDSIVAVEYDSLFSRKYLLRKRLEK